jgi:hypothetical protein
MHPVIFTSFVSTLRLGWLVNLGHNDYVALSGRAAWPDFRIQNADCRDPNSVSRRDRAGRA